MASHRRGEGETRRPSRRARSHSGQVGDALSGAGRGTA